jgi:hypothetical protein
MPETGNTIVEGHPSVRFNYLYKNNPHESINSFIPVFDQQPLSISINCPSPGFNQG